MRKRFPSEKSRLLAMVLFIPLLIFHIFFAALLIVDFEVAPLIILSLSDTFILLTWFRTYYETDDTHLLIKSCVFQWKIPYHSIERIEEVRSFMSSPSLSFNRLGLTYKRGYVMISPKHKAEFISTIRKRNPNIEVKDNPR
ncbi:PH domain-containing protein [Mechercharimyces sp. CAU 1602]|uniref:PH domain-containing protein n=1 Tax=Mechercharimyces sp. CAU 1602 TaxID=2973933 RepID=UPI002162C318|nr:PH domain-containing protein [Mechercharimyces sp. CAU 1602]MCS1351346.1 PH domain-containing protein [Mechercharimyces sp. CAU 1602]